MRIFFRMLLAIDAICLSALSLGMMMIAPSKGNYLSITEYVSDALYTDKLSGVLLFVVAFVFFCVNTTFLLSGLTSNKDRRAISKFSKIGEIKISINTLESLALLASKKINGVKETKAIIIKKNDCISIVIKAVVMQDINIPVLSEDIQVRVKKTVEETSGVTVNDVRVIVENIHSGYKSRVE